MTTRPSFSRWRRQLGSEFSILRALQYERLADVRFHGNILDIGGGDAASYRDLVTGHTGLVSLNLDPSIRPSVVADLNYPLPFRSNSLDGAVSLNTFEHVREDRAALRELLRVLRPGAAFHIFVPFLYRVHGSPSDFHRHTADWWRIELSDLGAMSVVADPLVWDPAATAFSIVEFNRARRLLRPLVLLRAVVAQRLRRIDRAARWNEYAMGYHVRGVAP